MRFREAAKLGREMLDRDDCHSDTFYGVFSPEYRQALKKMVAAADEVKSGRMKKREQRRVKHERANA